MNDWASIYFCYFFLCWLFSSEVVYFCVSVKGIFESGVDKSYNKELCYIDVSVFFCSSVYFYSPDPKF